MKMRHRRYKESIVVFVGEILTRYNRPPVYQLQLVYRAVVVAKLTYTSSSWWGFTIASDRQRLEGFLRRGCRQNLYSTDKPSITQIVEEAIST